MIQFLHPHVRQGTSWAVSLFRAAYAVLNTMNGARKRENVQGLGGLNVGDRW